jgi:hypothetical protein
MKFLSKENILNFLLIAIASAVGVVIFAPYVSSLTSRFLPKAS